MDSTTAADHNNQFSIPSTVAVIGLGYVGLPLCRIMHDVGHHVIGLDVDDDKIEDLREGRMYLHHLGDDFLDQMITSGRFEPTSDRSSLSKADAILICVPTPLDDHHQPDLHHVQETTDDIAKSLTERPEDAPPPLIVLESTTYPGTTREILKPILDRAGVPYYLAFSPERIDPGRTDPPVEKIPKVVGGIDEASSQAVKTLYSTVFEQVIPVSSADIAEASKLLENVYRAVNIALANEMKTVLEKLGINVWEVIEAAATKPYGFTPFYPGPGLGGHCIPIDPFYLSWKAKQVGTCAEFIELAGRVNDAMPEHVVASTLNALSERNGNQKDQDQPISILILGLAYKPDIDDVRESPSFELIRLFRERGCDVEYSDPHVPGTHHMRHWGDLHMTSVPITEESIANYDAMVIATAHRAFDWVLLTQHANLIVDTRNALSRFSGENIVRA